MKPKYYQPGTKNVGIITGEPNGSYHANSAISNSDLKDFARSPAYFKAKQGGMIERKESDALSFGSACHAMILEGNEAYLNQVAVLPQDAPERRSNAGKEWWDKFEERSAGKKLIKWEDDQRMRAMREAVKAHPVASRLLYENTRQSELTFRTAKLPQYGFAVQCRADLFGIDKEGSYIADLKTIDSLSADLSEFQRQFADYGYYRQCAFYRLVANTLLPEKDKVRRFYFVVVEKQAPYQVAVCKADELSLSLGAREIGKLLEDLAQCIKTDVWEGAKAIEHTIALPTWAQRKIEDKLIAEASA